MSGVAGSEGHLLELARSVQPLGWTVDAVIGSPRPAALREYAASLAEAGGGTVRVVHMPTDLSLALVRHIVAAASDAG
jgi:hypothetical protein